jgi:hypothetical protein
MNIYVNISMYAVDMFINGQQSDGEGVAIVSHPR